MRWARRSTIAATSSIPGTRSSTSRSRSTRTPRSGRSRRGRTGRARRAPARRSSQPTRPAIAFTRFATTGRAQLEDVVRALRDSGLAAHPERVFGVYRVPDRFDHNRNTRVGRYLEWEIAHRPGALAPRRGRGRSRPASSATTTGSRARPGEASVLDEDVAGALSPARGCAPEDCFGLHRLLNVRGRDAEEGKCWSTRVEGVAALQPAAGRDRARPTREMIARGAARAAASPLPFHVEILDWEAVAAWVSPHRYGPQRVPSPLPHLPSDMARADRSPTCEIVGVRSEDCYGVQVTRTAERSIADLSMASFRKNLRGNRSSRASTGSERAAMHLAEHVVLAYRDRADYEAGRARWRAYQDEVLHARLDHLTGVRPPIQVEDHRPPSFLSEVFDMFDPFGPTALPQVFHRNARPSLGPYCGELD